MDISTIGTIYVLQHNTTNMPYDEVIAEFWSKYTATPIEFYDGEQLMLLAQKTFNDYIRNTSDPNCEISTLYNTIMMQYAGDYSVSNEVFNKRIRNAIWTTLANMQIKNTDEFINGCKELNIEKFL